MWTVRRAEARRVAFIEQADAAPAVAQDLLVAHNLRTGELKYFLTNAARSLPTPACALQGILEQRCEGLMSDDQRRILAERRAADIKRTQRRNHHARVAARR